MLTLSRRLVKTLGPASLASSVPPVMLMAPPLTFTTLPPGTANRVAPRFRLPLTR